MGLATLVWKFDAEATDSESHQIARKQIEEMLGTIIPEELKDKITLKVKASRCAERVSKRARVGAAMNPEEVLQYRRPDEKGLPEEEEFREFIGDDGTPWKVSMVSVRYQVFANDNCVCQACGLKGTAMYLERDRSTKEGRAHFNLYGLENGKEVLFTKDHIIPSAKGGRDHLSNFQTYCSICNGLKGKHEVSNEQVAELRKVHDAQKDNKQKQIAAIKKTKLGVGNEKGFGKKKLKNVSAGLAKQLSVHARLRTKVTIAVLKNGEQLTAYSWGELKQKSRNKAYMTIPAGTLLQVNRSVSSSVVCFLDEEGTKVPIPYRHLEAPDEEAVEETSVEVREESGCTGSPGAEVCRQGHHGGGELERRTEGVHGEAGPDA